MYEKTIIKDTLAKELNKFIPLARIRDAGKDLLVPAFCVENGFVNINKLIPVMIDLNVMAAIITEEKVGLDELVQCIKDDFIKHDLTLICNHEPLINAGISASYFEPNRVRGHLIWKKNFPADGIVYFPTHLLDADIAVEFLYVLENDKERVYSAVITPEFLNDLNVSLTAEELFFMAIRNSKISLFQTTEESGATITKRYAEDDILHIFEKVERENDTVAVELATEDPVSGAFAILTQDGQRFLRKVAARCKGKISIAPISSEEVIITNEPFSKRKDFDETCLDLQEINETLEYVKENNEVPLYDRPLVFNLLSNKITALARPL